MPVNVVIGCAGSMKTTDICHYTSQLTAPKNTIQILAINSYSVASIVELFKKSYNITFKREKTTNHYINLKRRICVSTFDAWINHLQPDNTIRPDNFHQKIDTLNNLDSIHISSKNIDTPISHIFIDDAQDLNRIKTTFITKLIQQYPHIQFSIFGDILQSVFYIDYHPLRTFPTSQIEYRSVNYRCPPEHIHFLNILARPFFMQYEIPLMKPALHSTNPTNSTHSIPSNKPFLFTHSSITTANKCHDISIYVSELIETVAMNDPSVFPEDVAILMSRENDNHVFKHLSIPVNDVWRRVMSHRKITLKNKGGFYSIGHNKNGCSQTISSCIHNIRSRSFKLVILLGMTEKSIPKENDIGTSTEIISQSLFYSALTRSTKYLFIGMNCESPSSYIVRIRDHPETFYNGWDLIGDGDEGRDGVGDGAGIYSKLPRCSKPPKWDGDDDHLPSHMFKGFHICRSKLIIDTIKVLKCLHEREGGLDEFLERVQTAKFIDNDIREENSIHTAFLQRDVNRSISLFFDNSLSWEEKIKKHRRSVWNTAILYNQIYSDYIPKLETFIDCDSNYFF